MSTEKSAFLTKFRGYFSNLLKWEELDCFWETLRNSADAGWYIYAVGEPLPEEPANSEQVTTFITRVDELLRSEHDEDYCGIVYVDDRNEPSFIKIYDPNNLGSVCGSGSVPPPLPGWVLSLLPPEDLNAAFPLPANRRRWWQRIFD